jgi:hypothetical protein
VLFFSGLVWALWLFLAFGRALDHLLFPGFRRVEIKEPVFIIAPPRSGTTLLQKLLSLDTERFSCVRLYQTIFPCILYQRLIGLGVRLDRLCGGPLGRLVGWCERRFFGGWDDMHPLRLAEPEEDDGFFVYTFVTEAILLLFPYTEELWAAGFADALPPRRRRKVMAYYKSCLQRHLYLTGPHRTLLSKATQFCGSLEAIRETFPDARIVTIVRHPDESVASHVSVFYPVWRIHSPEIEKDSPESRAYAGLAVAWYRHVFETRGRFDPDRYFCLLYPDLRADPVRAVERTYRHFGFTLEPTYRARLEPAAREARSFKSRHVYSLEEVGLSRRWIRERLGDVLEAYGLEVPETSCGESRPA